MNAARVALVLLVAAGSLTACRSSDFSRIVRAVDSQPGVKRQYIPMLGLARTGVRMIHPHGIHDFRLAVFEHHHGGSAAARLDKVMATMPQRGWSPIVKVRSANGERTTIWAREAGKAMEMLILTHDRSESVVVEVAMDMERFFASFAAEPQRLGRSTMESVRGDE